MRKRAKLAVKTKLATAFFVVVFLSFNRLLAFSKEYPELCELTDDDECGCLSFRIQKKCFTYRISAPYSEERKATAREKMQELNARK